jgi:antitoxin component of MazEF toxin-antitoxin module
MLNQYKVYTMPFKAKLRKVGNSVVVTIPARYLEKLSPGEEIEVEIVGMEEVYTKPIEQQPLIKKPFNMEMCSKHPGSMKGTCGCK